MNAKRPVRFPELGAALQEARKPLRLSGNQFARLLTWSQSKVSRVEAGIIAPSVEDVRQWAAASGADEAALLAARDQALTGQFDLIAAARGSQGHVLQLQDHLADLEAASATLFEFQPRMVPGPLQHPDYARAWLTHPGRVSWVDAAGVDEIVAKRGERQSRLADAGVAVTVCVEQSALTADYGDPDALQAQLAVLEDASREARARVLVLQRAAPVLHGFELLDDAVLIESEFGLRVHSAPEQVQAWRQVQGWLEANSSDFTSPS